MRAISNGVQDAVIGQWRGLVPAETVATHLWVAVKHEITYRRPAFLTDEIIAVISLENVRGVTAFFDTNIRRGGETIAEVKSHWCCLHAGTRRPARITAAMVAPIYRYRRRRRMRRKHMRLMT